MKKKIIFIGAGLHSESLVEIIDRTKYKIIGFIDKKKNKKKILGNDEFLSKLKPKDFYLINGIYFNYKNNVRKKIFEKFKKSNFKFLTLNSKNTIIAKNLFIDEGSQILNGVIINNNVNIGKNTIINSGSIIEHDVSIGDHCTISPGTIICGNVKIGNNVNIGPGVVVYNSLKIGDNVFIQGGMTIKGDILKNKKIFNKNAI